MKEDTSRWRADWFKDPQSTLNACINEYRESSVRMSLVLVENGAYNKYEDMATNRVTVKNPFGDDEKEVASGSLENVHNNYHMYIGGYVPDQAGNRTPAGHMAAVPTSAFDPIFWFHHW